MLTTSEAIDLPAERALIGASGMAAAPGELIFAATEILTTPDCPKEVALARCSNEFFQMTSSGAIEVLAGVGYVRLERASTETQIRIRRRQEDWGYAHVEEGWPLLPRLIDEPTLPFTRFNHDTQLHLRHIIERGVVMPLMKDADLGILESDLLAALTVSMEGPFRPLASFTDHRSLLGALQEDGSLLASPKTFRNGVLSVDWSAVDPYAAPGCEPWRWPVLGLQNTRDCSAQAGLRARKSGFAYKYQSRRL